MASLKQRIIQHARSNNAICISKDVIGGGDFADSNANDIAAKCGLSCVYHIKDGVYEFTPRLIPKETKRDDWYLIYRPERLFYERDGITQVEP